MHPCTGQSANKAKTVRGKIPAGQAAVAHPGSTAGDFTFKFVPGLPSSTFGTSGAALGAMGAESGNSAREIRPCAAKRTRFLPIRTEPQRRADDAKEHRSDTSPHCEQTVNPDPDMPSRMLDPCLARLPSRGSCSAPSGGARLRTTSVIPPHCLSLNVSVSLPHFVIPPHYYRDPAHGPGVGSGLLPRVPPPTCSRPVSGVGLGPFVMRLLCCSLPAPARRQFFALRFATVCH
jgi:hypothetical protein